MMFGFGKSKKKVAAGSNWRKLEKDATKSKHYKGYKLKTQKTFRSTNKRPDFFGIDEKNPRKRIVGDAKCVFELKKNHVDQVKSYMKHPSYAKKGVIHTCKETKIPRPVRKYAKKSKISIERRNVSLKKKFFGL